jgi:hypothetical protein
MSATAKRCSAFSHNVRAADGNPIVCELTADHSGVHRHSNITWGWGADFTEKMSVDIWKPGARQDPQFICAHCGQHYLDHHKRGEWRAHFDAHRTGGKAA